LLLLVSSVVLGLLSLYPTATANKENLVLIDDSFNLTSKEYRRVGLGSFQTGENISLIINCTQGYQKIFSVVDPNATIYSTYTTSNISYSFITKANYYEAIFISNSTSPNQIHFLFSVNKQQIIYPFSILNAPAKTLFLLSSGVFILTLLKSAITQFPKYTSKKINRPTLSNKNMRTLSVLVLLSMVFWILIISVSANPLGTFENWYTDHARHSYVSTLFLKDGFAIFDKPLGQLASNDNSFYKFVTWPEMSHLYPLGSILVFFPFGAFLQSGVDQVLIFKLEIVFFVVVANICVYLFLKYFLNREMPLALKLVSTGILYYSLVAFAANGMFDSLAFFFSLIAILMFIVGRYDSFFLMLMLSVSLKYQAGIFLFPLIILGLIKLFWQNKFSDVLKNKAVIASAILASISLYTAYLSAPYFINTRAELSMNGINAFIAHPQISWLNQAFVVLLTLVVTVAFAVYMLRKNSLISMSGIFLLILVYTMPFFQNWYIPFLFLYALIPLPKKQLTITLIWLIFIIFMVAFGGVSLNFNNILETVKRFV